MNLDPTSLSKWVVEEEEEGEEKKKAHFETKFARTLLVGKVAYQKEHGGEVILYANRGRACGRGGLSLSDREQILLQSAH